MAAIAGSLQLLCKNISFSTGYDPCKGIVPGCSIAGQFVNLYVVNAT
jgi:hypothetical protein